MGVVKNSIQSSNFIVIGYRIQVPFCFRKEHMQILNYTPLFKRKERLYSLGDSGSILSQNGIEFDLVKVVFLSILPFLAIGLLVCFIFKKAFYNPFEVGNIWFYILTIGVGFTLGMVLYNVQLGGYRLYVYFLAYFRPKYVYCQDSMRKVSLTDKTVHGWVENKL